MFNIVLAAGFGCLILRAIARAASDEVQSSSSSGMPGGETDDWDDDLMELGDMNQPRRRPARRLPPIEREELLGNAVAGLTDAELRELVGDEFLRELNEVVRTEEQRNGITGL